MKKVISYLLVAALLVVSASFAGAASAEDGSSVSTIEAQGIKKVVKTEKRAISDDRIEVTTTVGEKVTGHLTLESNQLDGVIVVNPDKDGTERYVIASSEPFKEDNLQGYRGEIKNSDLCYEAFWVNQDKVIVNLYKLEEIEDSKEKRRVDPFTIVLDGSAVTQTTEIKTISERETLRSSTYDTIATSSISRGFDWEIQGEEGSSVDTPWVIRYWTKVDNVEEDADQTPSEITRVNMSELETKHDGDPGTYFEPKDPIQSGDTSIQIPFYIPRIGVVIIPVPVDSVYVSGTMVNPITVEYSWNLPEDARDFEEGINDQGLVTKFEYDFDGVEHNFDVIRVDVDSDVTYEVVGNYREYLSYISYSYAYYWLE